MFSLFPDGDIQQCSLLANTILLSALLE